jgi:hypothetical protein
MLVLGNENLLNEKLAVILNSSQSKTPCGCDSWLERTESAIHKIINDGYVIISSVGTTTWEIIAHLVGVNSGRQVLLSPVSAAGHEDTFLANVLHDFNLDPDNTAVVLPESEPRGRSPKKNWPIRDTMATAMAQAIYPISIRPNGKLDRLLKTLPDPCKINRSYQTEYAPPQYHAKRYDIGSFSPKVENWNYVTHWTKTRHGPWPNERRVDFYGRLLKSGREYPNNAFNTLRRIISDRKIRASSEKIRDSYSVIGFTDSSPDDALRTLRWCPRRVNWNFEPYGIAINKEAAKKIGMKPVIYGTVAEYKKFSDSARPFFQNRGGENVDWGRECEWRHIGDIDLSLLGADHIIYLVWTESEARIVRSITASRVIACSE